MNKTIFHVDVNSAYLSWEAAYRLQHGEKIDLRNIPAVVGGDPKTRHGIVLAKSIPAKKYGVQTGEALYSACSKCPKLTIVRPNYELYMKSSNAFINILKEYSQDIQRFSVDEAFIDTTSIKAHYSDPVKLAYTIKDRIHRELGFTISIGISNNKLLAKMGSDLKKPDAVTTLFPDEIKEKMWPLPISELYFVGRATAPKLKSLGIYTIGDLAKADVNLIKYRLKSHGEIIWKFANGIEDSKIRIDNHMTMKGLGNSKTIGFDVKDKKTAHLILLSLTEMTAMRLRDSNNLCTVISVKLRTNEFMNCSHQRKLYSATDCTKEIYKTIKMLFDEVWDGNPLRNLGIRFSGLIPNNSYQYSFFDDRSKEKLRTLDNTIDNIRMKFGSKYIMRARFLHSGIKPMTGGVYEDYPVITSIL